LMWVRFLLGAQNRAISSVADLPAGRQGASFIHPPTFMGT